MGRCRGSGRQRIGCERSDAAVKLTISAELILGCLAPESAAAKSGQRQLFISRKYVMLSGLRRAILRDGQATSGDTNWADSRLRGMLDYYRSDGQREIASGRRAT